MLTFTDDEFADKLEAETGERPDWSAQAFSDLGTDIRDGIERIKASSFIPHTDKVRGFVYEVDTGELHEVSRQLSLRS
jgi:carbonic anhydrase